MNRANCKEMLEKVSPPQVILPSSKAMLRRKLLNSKHFTRKPFRQVFFKYALRIAPVFGIFLVVVISIFMTGKMSAMERLRHLESTYHSSFVSGSVHYIKALFSSSRDENRSMILQQWRYGDDKLRIMLQRKSTGKTVGHLIAKGEHFYLRVDETSAAKIKVQKAGGNMLPGENHIAEKPCVSKAYSTLMLPVENIPGKDRKKKLVNVIISEDTLEIFGFAPQDPAKIFVRLKSSPTVTYAGSEPEERTTETGEHWQRRLEIFTRKTSPEIRSFLLEYDQDLEKDLERVVEKLQTREIQGHPNSRSNGNTPGNYLEEGGFRIEKIEVLETTKVDKDTGKIALITYQSFRRGQLVARHELTFLREQFLPYDPALFNEKLFQLEAYEPENIPGPGN